MKRNEGRWSQDKVETPASVPREWFGGRACRNFGVWSEGTRFHLGASRRHGSQKEPDEWGARDIQAV